MIYDLSMFGTNIFAVTLNYNVIGIQATGFLGKCGRTVFKIVLPTDDFEAIKNGITLVARLLQCFACLILVKTMSRKFSGFSLKDFADSAKHCCFPRFHGGSRNMFKNTSEGNWCFISISTRIKKQYLFNFQHDIFETSCVSVDIVAPPTCMISSGGLTKHI